MLAESSQHDIALHYSRLSVLQISCLLLFWISDWLSVHFQSFAMKLSLALFSNALFASATFATLVDRFQEGYQTQDRFGLPISVPTNAVAGSSSSNVLPTQYYTNWAGGVISPPPSGQSFYAVLGTFTVPLPSPPVSGAGTWKGSAWVGVSDASSIVQAGVSWAVTVSSTGAYSYQYNAWYEWLPYGATNVDLVVNAGDVIDIWCEATSSTAGWCIINNLSTGVEITYPMTAPSGTSISGTTVEWIVEDFSSGGLVPFANFGEVTFTNCIAVASPNYNSFTYVYPNSTTAYAADIVAVKSGATAYTPITAVSFPTNADQVIEINYIGFK